MRREDGQEEEEENALRDLPARSSRRACESDGDGDGREEEEAAAAVKRMRYLLLLLLPVGSVVACREPASSRVYPPGKK
ncbi:hypothetical protein PR003_g4227 [Phytophthora rubi]|uniref:Uncharacterized protein n=1 Tax=Phytophthora rubi TaxID=129364 RepID=A0A6A3NRV7_9STRA|nr:hypothetical protein PR001_g3881 [Phytophthora rubi]KAE9352729.1 hypothetical protein PR003_g4227 [Phytophthora rubi]